MGMDDHSQAAAAFRAAVLGRVFGRALTLRLLLLL
jgi:hypothetical protein